MKAAFICVQDRHGDWFAINVSNIVTCCGEREVDDFGNDVISDDVPFTEITLSNGASVVTEDTLDYISKLITDACCAAEEVKA